MNNCTVKETEIDNILYTIQSYPLSKGFANTNNNLKMYGRIMLQEPLNRCKDSSNTHTYTHSICPYL